MGAKAAKNFLENPLYKASKACYNIQANKCTGGSMDRASDSGSEGWGFESLPVYQRRIIRTTFAGSDYFYTFQRTRTIKCGADERHRRRLDGAEP